MDKQNKIDLKTLVQSGVHFGHQTSKWSPKMKPYIWGSKNSIHLIDVSKTAYQLEKAAKFLDSVASEGKQILWVGTKKAAKPVIQKTGQDLNLPYVVNRWIGGTLTNYRQVKKSVGNLLNFEEILGKSDTYNYSKKELVVIRKKMEKLQECVGGIRHLAWPVGALVVVDVKKEHVAIKEAVTMGIPVVALVDTNSDPAGIDYVIPANDDSPRSINLLIEYLGQIVASGQEKAKEKAAKEEQEKISQKAKPRSADKPKKEEVKADNLEDSNANQDKVKEIK